MQCGICFIVFFSQSFVKRLVFNSDGVGVVVGVIIKRASNLLKIENQSHKQSHKFNGIAVRKIRTFLFLPILFTTLLLNDPVKTRLLESEAEAEEPTNHKAQNQTL